MSLVMLVQALMLTVGAFATTVDSPHYDTASGFVCTTCHTTHLSLGSTGYNNVCLSCHRPGDPAAGVRPITPGDAANPFGTYTADSKNYAKNYQTSHRFEGSDTVPAAGAQAPIQAQMTTGNLRGRTAQALACVRCHNQHDNSRKDGFLRIANDQDQLCLDCHRSRNTTDHKKGTHPVGVAYDGTKAGFKPIPANGANSTADLNNYLKNGKVSCSTCHGVHFTDSRSGTVDGSANFANLSSGDGNLLRTDLRGAKVAAGLTDNANICTNCHAGKRNHNKNGQDVQCTSCHGAHVEYDPKDPTGASGTNVYLIRRAVPAGVSGSGTILFRYTGSTRKEYKNSGNTGVCQGCHTVPAPNGIYPNEHAGSDPKVCNTCHFHNSSNGSFSGACTSCHGYPPIAAVLGGPSGLALPATGATATSPGAHETHAKGRSMACNTCHTGYSSKAMPSNTIDIGFAINGSNFPGFSGAVTGGTFNGTILNSGYSWNAAGGTTLTTGNSAVSCAVYCHGSALTGGSAAKIPVWTTTDGTQKACGACHGVTAATAPLTGNHQRHAGNGVGGLALICDSCHGAHGNNDHVNGSVEWSLSSLNGGGLYKGSATGATGTVAPSTSFGQCSSLYCHSNGTTLQAPFAVTGTVPTWGGAALSCSGCHDGTATGPAYPNGTPKANSHAIHVVSNGYGCNTCHYDTTTNGSGITNSGNHANRAFNLAPNTGVGISYSATVGTPTTPSICSNISCHGPAPNSATWGTTLGCQSCHFGTTDNDVFSTPFTSASPVAAIKSADWTGTGHGRTVGTYASGNAAANMAGANQCLYCHDNSIGHNAAVNPFRLRNFADAGWGKNGVCMVCHVSGSAGVTIGATTLNSGKKVTSTHKGYGHLNATDAGQFCWDCHDAHGDGNMYMIHDNIYPTSDVTTGVPTGTAAAVSFTAATTGTDYARSSAPFNGVCNVCHTATSHYTSTAGDGHNSTTRCTSCHSHDGVDAVSAFGPSGSSCDACHGYPPARPGFVPAPGNWANAVAQNYSSGGGAHTVQNHVSKTAVVTEGFVNCTRCHNVPADHKMSPIVFKPSQNIKARLNQRYRMEATTLSRYTSNRLDGSSHIADSCSNISCHYGTSPSWNQR